MDFTYDTQTPQAEEDSERKLRSQPLHQLVEVDLNLKSPDC
jgi:hypothetical protein